MLGTRGSFLTKSLWGEEAGAATVPGFSLGGPPGREGWALPLWKEAQG